MLGDMDITFIEDLRIRWQWLVVDLLGVPFVYTSIEEWLRVLAFFLI